MTAQKPSPIPILSILHDAIAIPWHKRATMFWALLPISVALIAASMMGPLILEGFGNIGFLIWIIILGLAGVLFAITCHRLVLLGNESVPKYGLASWTARETRFVGWTLAAFGFAAFFGFIVNIPVLVLIAALSGNSGPPPALWVASACGILAWIPGYYLFARLSILLPATAVDERPSVVWARQLTRGNGWRLFLIVILLPVFITLGSGILFFLLGHSVIANLLISATGCVLGVIQVAALSLSYKHLTESSTALGRS